MMLGKLRIRRFYALVLLAGCFWFSQSPVVRASGCNQNGYILSCCGATTAAWYTGQAYGTEWCEINQSTLNEYCEGICGDCGMLATSEPHNACTAADEYDDGEMSCDCVPPM